MTRLDVYKLYMITLALVMATVIFYGCAKLAGDVVVFPAVLYYLTMFFAFILTQWNISKYEQDAAMNKHVTFAIQLLSTAGATVVLFTVVLTTCAHILGL